jgi:hypothetical protein
MIIKEPKAIPQLYIASGMDNIPAPIALLINVKIAPLRDPEPIGANVL